MSRFWKALATATVLAVLGAWACAEEPLRAAIFYQSDIWVQDINIMHQIAEAIEANLSGHEEVALSAYGLGGLSLTQAARTAVNMRTDVMISYSLDSPAALAAYAMLAARGVRLILVDGDVPESGRYAYTGTDNEAAGALAVKLIAENCGGDARVAMLAPDMDTSLRSVGARLAGFRRAAETAGLQIEASVETTYDAKNALARVQALLDAHPTVNALFCAEAVSGQAAADVVRERGLQEDVMVVTFDWNSVIERDVRDGTIDVTLTQDIEGVGRACAQALIDLAADRTRETGADALLPCIPKTRE